MTTHKIPFLFLLGITLLFARCNSISLELTQEDLDQYMLAYEKFADNKELLDTTLEESGAIILHLCQPCQPILDSIAIEAGYSNFESFVLMDLRVIYTMRYVAYLQISEYIGKTVQDVPDDNICEGMNQEDLNEEERADLEKFCRHLSTFVKCIGKLSQVLGKVTDYLFQVHDIEIVQANYDDLYSALTNPDLPNDMGASSGYDD